MSCPVFRCGWFRSQCALDLPANRGSVSLQPVQPAPTTTGSLQRWPALQPVWQPDHGKWSVNSLATGHVTGSSSLKWFLISWCQVSQKVEEGMCQTMMSLNLTEPVVTVSSWLPQMTGVLILGSKLTQVCQSSVFCLLEMLSGVLLLCHFLHAHAHTHMHTHTHTQMMFLLRYVNTFYFAYQPQQCFCIMSRYRKFVTCQQCKWWVMKMSVVLHIFLTRMLRYCFL